MSDINYQIDLDALFDMLNAGGNRIGKINEASGEIIVSCSNLSVSASQESLSFDTNLFYVDLSADQS